MRTILHVDFNGFYASCEEVYNPEYKKVPMAVGGEKELRHGIILAKNQLAKEFKVKTAEAIWQARQKCPQLVIVPPRYKLYQRFSKQGRKIFGEYSPRIEPFGMDEAWIDLMGSSIEEGTKVAHEIRERVKRELGLTASVGVSFNKIFAKLGSDLKKPDATTVIDYENFREIVWGLPASDLLMVGPRTKEKLNRVCIHTIGDIARCGPEKMKKMLGKWGEQLWIFASGLDQTPVCLDGQRAVPIKTVGNSITTPRDMKNERDVEIIFDMLIQSVSSRLRDLDMVGRVVQISVRNNLLCGFERQCTLPLPTRIPEDILSAAMKLFRENYDWKADLRSIGVRVSNLSSEEDPFQLSFLDESRNKHLMLNDTVDDIRGRFGYQAIKKGIQMEDRKLTLDMNIKDYNTVHPASFIVKN